VTETPTTVAEGREFRRLAPAEAFAMTAGGALLLDIRRAELRHHEGEIPGALVVSGPIRDWRLDHQSPERVTDLGERLPVVVVGDGSAASVLVASALRGHGVRSATDVAGGFAAWRDAGLPVSDSFTLAGRRVAVPEDLRELVPA